MRRILLLVALLLGLCTQVYGQVLTPNVIVYQKSAQTIASNGNGATAATGTVTVAEISYVKLLCNDPQGCTMTLSETGASEGQALLILIDGSSTTATFNNSSGVQELTGGTAYAGAANGAVMFQYTGDRWVEVTRSLTGASGLAYLFSSGSSGSPSIAFSAETTSGLYRFASGKIGITSDLVPSVSATKNLGDSTHLFANVFANALNNGNTLTLPTSVDTLVGRATTDTLTNKTIQCFNLTSTLQQCGVTLTLSDAQIKALPSTPIQVVAAAGAGKRVLPIKGLWRATTTAGAYTNINVTISKLRLVYGANVTIASEEVDATQGTNLATFLGTASVQEVILHNWEENIQPIANTDNIAVNVSIDNNGSGNLTGGNAADTLVISFLYLVIG